MLETEITTGRKHYFVSVIDPDTRRKGLLAGPYTTHPEALAQVAKVRKMAEAADPRAVWYAFGTSGSDEPFKTVFGVVS